MTYFPELLRHRPEDTVIIGDIDAWIAVLESGSMAEHWEELCTETQRWLASDDIMSHYAHNGSPMTGRPASVA